MFAYVYNALMVNRSSCGVSCISSHWLVSPSHEQWFSVILSSPGTLQQSAKDLLKRDSYQLASAYLNTSLKSEKKLTKTKDF